MPLYFAHETAIIDDGARIGVDAKIWHFVHIMPDAVIGDRSVIGQNVFIGKGVKIGNDCRIQNNAFLPEGVILEDAVFIGPSVVFTNVRDPRALVCKRDEFKTTTVQRGATIGAAAVILPGLNIGPYAFIAAGAVVTKNIGPRWIMMGVPAMYYGLADDTGVPKGMP